MAKAKNVKIDLQSGTDRTIFATWDWSKKNTENYKVRWLYGTGDGVWFVGNESTSEFQQSTYTAPENAKKVAFKVKPVAKKHKVNGKEVSYWTADWSTRKEYSFSSNPPSKPNSPALSLDNLRLTMRVDNLDTNSNYVQFSVHKNDSSNVFIKRTVQVKSKSASLICDLKPGTSYKVRCRAAKSAKGVNTIANGTNIALNMATGNHAVVSVTSLVDASEWSDYSSIIETPPEAPKSILECRALSATSIYISWHGVDNAKSYNIQYTDRKSRFDSAPNEVSSTTVESVVKHAEITGLASGSTYYFRVRAANDKGVSAWTNIASTTVGKEPSPPTTWSTRTTVIAGEELNLYWVHNTEDGSRQREAQIELDIDGVVSVDTKTYNVDPDVTDPEEAYSYPINTTSYPEGTKIKWRVRTKGVYDKYSEWSIQRIVDIYAAPTLELTVSDSPGTTTDGVYTPGPSISSIEQFPIYISAEAGPTTQKPIGYHISVIALESHDSVDSLGNDIVVGEGEEVYSKYFDSNVNPLIVELSAGNINLENNISYGVIATVSMDSGLTAEAADDFTVSWTDAEYEPNAEIGIDYNTLSALIRPYCADEEDNLVEGVTLSVYRREFDGTFTEIGTGISSNTFVIDPHPSLDYARYRIVATDDITGAISYYDVPGYPVGETAVIIQWDEAWSEFDTTEESEMEEPAWVGSMLRLPYNIDVSDSNSIDVEHVEYIGRKHPVTYYGTHLGTSSTWNVEIEKNDIDTLYALRRLARYMGDVYVREPSGSGYWASISVSYNQKHRALTIPVTFNVTRVEGGI